MFPTNEINNLANFKFGRGHLSNVPTKRNYYFLQIKNWFSARPGGAETK